MNNTTTSIPIKSNGTGIPGYNPFYRTKAEIIAQIVSLAVLGVIIVCGNLASIITFLKSQSLRRRSHYLIISLSAADLLVGVVDFMCVYFFWTGPQWNTFIVTLEVMDTLTGIASILTLSNIAIERFYAILFPFRHRRLRFRVYVALCAFPWITATYISALYFTSYVYDRSVLEIYNYHTFSVATIALVLILFSYITIGVKLSGKNNPGAQDQNRSSRDQKLAVTLLIVTLASLLTWMPLQGFLLILYFCRSSCKLPHFNVLFLMKFIQFCNSGINVFIYIVRMPEFRRAFLALFCGKSEQNMRVQDSTRMTSASMKNNGFVGDQMRAGQSCRNRSMGCPRNTSSPPSYNNLQKAQSGNLQGSYETNKNNAHIGGVRPNTINPTNQNPLNCYDGPGSENLSRNTSQPEVTKDGESSLDKIDISFEGTRGKESGYQHDMTNHEYKSQQEVKGDGQSSLKIDVDDLGVGISKKTGYQQGVANYGYESKANGTEDSQL